MSTVSLSKGESVSLKKAASDAGATAPLSNLIAGAGWDPAEEGAKVDLDLMIVLIGEDGKPLPDANGQSGNLDEALLFFNNKELAGLKHTGDNRTGEGDGDDEQVLITLGDLAANVKELAIVVASYGTNGTDGVSFDKVKNAVIRMVNADDNSELARYEVSTGYDGKFGVELGRLTRDGSFTATGNALEGSNFNEVVEKLGVHGE